MKAYKGFNKDMTCRGFHYEEGKSYETDSAVICEEGFHACENPIDCFGYYVPAESVYHEVEIEPEDRAKDDTKVVGKKIKIGARIGIRGIIEATFEYVKEHCTNHEEGADWSALNGGNRSALNGGNRSALNGGYRSALNGGNRSALNGGNWSALNGGDRSVCYAGEGGRVKAGAHSVIAIQYWQNGEFIKIIFAEVDGKKIKADTWYTLNDDGELVEWTES